MSYNFIYDYSKKRMDNPQHITDYSLLYLANKEEKIITLKADGIYQQQKINNILYESEYMEELNFNLVFDFCLSNTKYSKKIFDRNLLIRSSHTYAKYLLPINKVSKTEDIIQIYKDDNELLNKYLSTTTDKIKWWPKLIIKIDITNNDYLHLMDIQIPVLYKTDGYILYDNCNDKIVYKYKPKKHITIDIRYIKTENLYLSSENIIVSDINTNVEIYDGIWRCYWDNSKWHPINYRHDKKVPNKIKIINELTQLHKLYWCASDLLKYNTINLYYNISYDHIKDDIQNLLIYQKTIFNTNIHKIITDNNVKNIIDLGCGNGSISRNFYNLDVCGIDIDYNCLHKNSIKYYKHKWYLSDLSTNTSKILHDLTYDLIVCNNSLHNFSNMLDNLVNVNSIIYINFMDDDKINMNGLNIDNEIIITKTNTITSIYYCWLKQKLNETLLSSTQIKKLFKDKWNIYEIENKDTTHKYSKFLDLHTTFIFTIKSNNII